MFDGTVARVLMAGAIAVSGSTATADEESLKLVSDPERDRAYVLVRDGVDVLEASTRRKLARVTLPGWVWADEAYSAPPDIALAPQGDILVTSNVLPVLWRIDRRTLGSTVHPLALDQDRDKDVGFTRLRWSPGLRTFVAWTDSGARWHIDAALGKAWKVSR